MIVEAEIVSVNTDPDLYHSEGVYSRGRREFVVSNSILKEFSHCPLRWVNGYSAPTSDAKDYGSLLDCVLLTPDKLSKRYVVQPSTYPAPATHQLVKKGEIKEGDPLEWNGNATYCREWKAANANLQVITEAELAESKNAVDSARRDSIVSSLIDCSDRQVYLRGSWKDKTTDLVIPIKAMLDLVPRYDTEWSGSLADVKTTRNASRSSWTRFAWSMKYFQQAAFYSDFYCAATGEERDTFLFVLQENFKPWMVARRMVSQRLLEIGRIQYQTALKLYAHCIATNKWPDYDTDQEAIQGWTLVDAEQWMETEIQRMQVAPPEIERNEVNDEDQEVGDVFH